jgi:predicted site-specific integrase-resolvase
MTARPPADALYTPVPDPDAALYTVGEVGTLLRVDPRTVTRWDQAGRFPAEQVIRTLGGHRRFRGDYIRSLMNGSQR